MNDVLEDRVREQLHDDVAEMVIPPTPQRLRPQELLRAGRRRVHQHRAAQLAGVAVVVVAAVAGGAVGGLTGWGPDGAPPAAPATRPVDPGPNDPVTQPEESAPTDEEAARGAAEDALRVTQVKAALAEHLAEAGHPGNLETYAGVGYNTETGRYDFWEVSWTTGVPGSRWSVQVIVRPEDPEGSGLDTGCRRGDADARGCETIALPGGAEMVSGEWSGGGLTHETGIVRTWTPSASISFPDGRSVLAEVHRAYTDGDPALPPGEVLAEYAGPLTMDQLEVLAQEPLWAELPLPAQQ